MAKRGQKNAVMKHAQKTGNVRQLNAQQKAEEKKQAEQLQKMVVNRMMEIKKTLFAILTKLNQVRGESFQVNREQLEYFYQELHKSDDVKHFNQYEKIDQRLQLLNHLVANLKPETNKIGATDEKIIAEIWNRYNLMTE